MKKVIIIFWFVFGNQFNSLFCSADTQLSRIFTYILLQCPKFTPYNFNFGKGVATVENKCGILWCIFVMFHAADLAFVRSVLQEF